MIFYLINSKHMRVFLRPFPNVLNLWGCMLPTIYGYPNCLKSTCHIRAPSSGTPVVPYIVNTYPDRSCKPTGSHEDCARNDRKWWLTLLALCAGCYQRGVEDVMSLTPGHWGSVVGVRDWSLITASGGRTQKWKIEDLKLFTPSQNSVKHFVPPF